MSEKRDMGLQVFILLPLVLFTSVFSGIFGMAGGMILMAGLLFFYSPPEAIFIHGILQFFANFQRYYQLKAYADIKVLFYYLVGSLLSFLLLRHLDFVPSEKAIYIFMAVSAFIGAFRFKVPFSLKNKTVAGFAGMLVSALQIAGISGAILDVLCQDKRLSRYEVVALKSAAISVSHFLKVIFMYLLLGSGMLQESFTSAEIFIYLVAVVSGTFLGKKILDRLSDQNFFKYTSLILLTIAVYYFYRAV